MEGHGQIRRRRLPHWNLPGATYFITTCLEGSIPAEGLLELARFRANLPKMARSVGRSQNEWETDCWKRTFALCDDWLDGKPAVRHFDDAALATEVAKACYYWAGRRYDLLAYVVMPSHLHWVFRPIVGQVANLPTALDEDEIRQVGNLPHNPPKNNKRSFRERIMHTLKLHTAIACNRHLARKGKLWQEESYDHCVRDDGELERIINYVEQNPVKAGLIDAPEKWRFSSAHDRIERGIMLGEPLLPLVGQVANLPFTRGNGMAGWQPAPPQQDGLAKRQPNY